MIIDPGTAVDWSGWQLLNARDTPQGYHVRIRGEQFAATVEVCGTLRNTVRFLGGRTPLVIWEGHQVWTFTG